VTRPPWLDDDARACWHPYTQHALDPEPLPVVGARGAWLELADGRRVLDATSSWWAVLHGHGEPALLEAMARQAAALDHVLFAGCSHEPAARLAAELVDVAPEGLTRVFYSDDGSTAVEVALKAAYLAQRRRGGTERTTFVALEGGYHGDTFGAMSVGDPVPFFGELAPLLFDVVRVERTVEALETAFAAHGRRAAAMILEPLVQGAAGMRPVPAGVVRAARQLCDEQGVLLVADEVMTGFGRTGQLFACDGAGVAPDLLCLAKGLGGGLFPIAATLATEEIFSAFLAADRAKALFHGHTFTAHPVGCAVARASLRLVRERDVPSRLREIGARVESALVDLRDDRRVRDVRRIGGIVAVELASPEGGYLAQIGEALRAACRRLPHDVLLRPLGPVVYAMLPACATDDEADRAGRAIRTAVGEATHG
jgi:adenosylmethionine-8-amino-7-oxononanoate aminotransferase